MQANLPPKYEYGASVLVGALPDDEYLDDPRFAAVVVGHQGYEPPASYLVAAENRHPDWLPESALADLPEGWTPRVTKVREVTVEDPADTAPTANVRKKKHGAKSL